MKKTYKLPKCLVAELNTFELIAASIPTSGDGEFATPSGNEGGTPTIDNDVKSQNLWNDEW